VKRADTQKERDEELLNGLLKLDAPKLEVWRYFSDRADRFTEQLWTTGTWIFGIIAAVLALPFVAKFIEVDSKQLIRFESRPLSILVCLRARAHSERGCTDPRSGLGAGRPVLFK
jgi:hypothetical protein